MFILNYLKKVILLLVLLLTITFVSACEDVDNDGYCIDITSPLGGETYNVGDTVQITWTQKNIDLTTIGYKTCESCLDWIKFTHYVDPLVESQNYEWVVPENLAGRNVAIDITGYKTGTGNEYDISEYFYVKPLPEPTKEIDVALISVDYLDDNPTRNIPLVEVYNILNKGNLPLSTNELRFTTTIGDKTKELLIPYEYIIYPKSNLYLYVNLVFDEEVGETIITYKVEGREINDIDKSDNTFVKTIFIDQLVIPDPIASEDDNEDFIEKEIITSKSIIANLRFGETKIYTLNKIEYEIKIESITDYRYLDHEININGEKLQIDTSDLERDYELADGSKFRLLGYTRIYEKNDRNIYDDSMIIDFSITQEINSNSEISNSYTTNEETQKLVERIDYLEKEVEKQRTLIQIILDYLRRLF